MTLDQLKEYDGTGPEGRVLVAVNGKIFDVTKGSKIYSFNYTQCFSIISRLVTGLGILSGETNGT